MAEQEHQAYIIIHGPGHEGTRLALREGITSFGRLPSNDVILLGDLVSRHHSRITFFEGRATLQDLGSHNGSWVNGERVATRVLKPGDVARVGNFRLAFNDGPLAESVSGPIQAPADSQDGAYNKQTATPSYEAPSTQRPMALSEEIRQALHEPNRGTELLLKASEAAASTNAIPEYMQAILTLVLEQIPSGVGAYVSHQEGQLNIVTARSPQGPLSNPPVSMRLPHWVISKNFAVMTEDVTTDVRFAGPPTGDSGRIAALCAPVSAEHSVLGAIYLSRDGNPYEDPDLDALTSVAHICSGGLTNLEKRAQNQGTDLWQRTHAPQIAEILQSGAPGLKPQAGTIAFCDTPGFETIAERTAPEGLSVYINRYLQQISEIAQRHGGSLLQAQGSKLTLLFGLPQSTGQDTARAVAAALEMRSATDLLAQHHPTLSLNRLRIGMSTGTLYAGLVGTPQRMTYTVLGSSALMAQRLESAASPGSVLVGESTFREVHGHFEARRLGLQQGRGQAGPLPVFEILSRKTAQR